MEAHGGADTEICEIGRAEAEQITACLAPCNWPPDAAGPPWVESAYPRRHPSAHAGATQETPTGEGEGPASGFCCERHPNGPFATLIRSAAIGWPIRIAADGTCQVWRGEGVWQSNSLNGITLRQLPQIPGGGDFLPNFLPKEVAWRS